MQINIKMSKELLDYAPILRNNYFGNSSSKEYRDSFVFARAIDDFNSSPQVLTDYINSDDNLTIQKMISLRQNTYDKLLSLSKTLDCSVASIYRAIIQYTNDNLEAKKDDTTNQELLLKISLLEKQLFDCQQTLAAIKEYM
ncbi:hypothetical protein [Enterococcus columbae]|uniref:Uncharacterized protein n=1 Tax=Enterococcus columbae DSM 7374 = ATCC 51263 TaxID=1121865 RepID=S0KRD5_9ENTE|nr:hypothetical protein [Enterococcus columbae]EOT43555.1 hypothetical protein OMW_00769 [Enterococcus columbae DSM 7374 = ATCC 51263]EOW87391.1 hypothetical protein I568_00435 [Enterococcus columbae DSM 7374 = ATCC 51263]